MQHIFGFFLLLSFISPGLCLIEQIDLPPFLKNCLRMKTKKQDVTQVPSESVCNACVTRYMWLEGPNLKKCGNRGDNTTMSQITSFFGKLLCDHETGTRKKRQVNKRRPMRQEYRTLTKVQRQRFHVATNKAYKSGYFGWLARFHNEQVRSSAHAGPAFLGYHRFLLLILEKILQRFDPTIAIPYWNSVLDSNLDIPEQSIIWSDDYFGPGNGIVNSGPFAGWKDLRGNRIIRTINQGGSLFTSAEIKDILRAPNIYSLTEPSPYATLESYHDDVHNYIGGTMTPIEEAPWDIIFWLHHCFVDYIWEVWRYNHGYNTVYPIYQGLPQQHPNKRMSNMPYINFLKRVPINRDGYSVQLAKQSSYQLSPTCSRQNPNCGSVDLQCRLDRNPPECVAVDRRYRKQTLALNAARLYKNVRFNTNQRTDIKNRFNANQRIGINNRFNTSQRIGFKKIFNTNKRIGIKNRFGTSQLIGRKNSFNTNQPFGIKNRFNTNRRSGRKKRDTSNAGYYTSGYTVKSVDIDKIYIPQEKETCMGQPVQNSFLADCSSDVKKWAFIPVKVVHLRPNDVYFKSSSQLYADKGIYDMYDEHEYEDLKKFVHPGNPATYQDCREDTSGAFKVRIKSYGISYFGIYTDYVFVDNRLPISSHVGYIAVEKPTSYKPTMAFITASDSCGRLCKPTCAKREGNVVYHVPCSGAIKVTDQSPAMYGRDFGEAILSIWHFYGNYTPFEREDNMYIIFYCDYSNEWPWPECKEHANKG